MSPCPGWKERLLDVALGAGPLETVESHVETCLSCREALARLRETRSRMDAALERIGRTEPPPGFRVRVLARVRGPQAARRRFWVPAAAVVSMAAGLWLVTLRKSPSPPLVDAPDLFTWRSPTESLMRSATDELFESPPRLGTFYFSIPNPTVEDDDVESQDPI